MSGDVLKEYEEKQKDLLWDIVKNISADVSQKKDFIYWDDAQEVVKDFFKKFLPEYSGSTEELILIQRLEDKSMVVIADS